MEYDLPVVGTRYKKGCQVRKVVEIKHRIQGPPDIIFIVPGRKLHSGQWYPLWAEWVQGAEIIS
jgi:hypothetical protein